MVNTEERYAKFSARRAEIEKEAESLQRDQNIIQQRLLELQKEYLILEGKVELLEEMRKE